MADDLLSILGGNDPEPVAAPQGTPQARKPGGANSAMADPASALHGALGGAVTITSLRRSAEHNAEVGGVPDSYHLTGHAVDFHPPAGMTNAQAVARLRQSGMPFVELLDEGNHVHVAWNGPSVGEMKSGGGSMAGSDDLLSLLGGSDSAPATAPVAAPTPAAAPAPQTVKPDADTAYSQAFSGLRPIERVARWNDKGELVRPDTGKPFPAAVSKTYAMLMKGGLLSPDAPVGSAKNPLVQDDPANTPTPGQFYIEANTGVLKQQPTGAPKGIGGELGAGASQGLGDVVNTIGRLFPGGQDSELGARLQANQLFYNAQHGGNGWADLGRMGGEMAASAPLMMTGAGALGRIGAGLADAAPALAPAVDFLGGTGGGGNVLMRAASQGVKGAQEGAGFTTTTSAASDRPLGEQLGQGAGAGGLIAAALPFGGALGRAAGFAGGAEGNPAVATLAQKAIDSGINLRAGQISQAPAVRVMDSVLGRTWGTGYGAQNVAQRAAFNSAIAKTLGESLDKGENLAPPVMARAKERIGSVFDKVAANTKIQDRDGLLTNIGNVIQDASGVLPEQEVSPLKKQLENIAGAFGDDGVMNGDAYQALTRKGAPLDRLASSADPNVRHYAGQIREALDDSLEASASPGDLADLRQARLQYKNLKTVEPLAAKGNGDISPALLLQKVLGSYKNYAYSGGGDLGDLAQIGQTFLKEPPSSMTAERTGAMNLLKLLGIGGTGAELAMMFHDPAMAAKIAGFGAAAAGTTALTGRAVGAALNNPWYRNALLEGATSAGAPRAVTPLLPRGAAAANRLLIAPLLSPPSPALAPAQ